MLMSLRRESDISRARRGGIGHEGCSLRRASWANSGGVGDPLNRVDTRQNFVIPVRHPSRKPPVNRLLLLLVVHARHSALTDGYAGVPV